VAAGSGIFEMLILNWRGKFARRLTCSRTSIIQLEKTFAHPIPHMPLFCLLFGANTPAFPDWAVSHMAVEQIRATFVHKRAGRKSR
jgi:hypothetical protein